MKRKKRDEKRWAPGKWLFWVFIRFPFFIYLWHTTASVTWASPFLSTSLLDDIAIVKKGIDSRAGRSPIPLMDWNTLCAMARFPQHRPQFFLLLLSVPFTSHIFF